MGATERPATSESAGVRLVVSYDGTGFHGFADNRGVATVAGALCEAISTVVRRPVELAAAGRFRADLFYRLNVLTLALPPLRERREDIEPLASHFLRQFALAQGQTPRRLSLGALLRLMGHNWPGNVRELRHVIERAVLLSEGPELRALDIEIDGSSNGDNPPFESFQVLKARVVDNFERSYIETLLTFHQGNVAAAARTAGKHRRAFFELMRKHQINATAFRPAH